VIPLYLSLTGSLSVEERKRVDQIAELKYKYNRKFPPGPGESQKEVEERALNQKRSDLWKKNPPAQLVES